jgi:hypothetical protein
MRLFVVQNAPHNTLLLSTLQVPTRCIMSLFKKKKKHKPEQHEKHPDRNYLGSPMPLCQNAVVLDLLLCLYDIY